MDCSGQGLGPTMLLDEWPADLFDMIPSTAAGHLKTQHTDKTQHRTETN